MASLSEIGILKGRSVEEDIAAFCEAFRTVCTIHGVPKSADGAQQVVDKGAKDLVLDLILALQNLPNARWLPSPNGRGTLFGDLSRLISVIDSDDFAIESVTRLLSEVVSNSSGPKVWSTIKELISEPKPPTRPLQARPQRWTIKATAPLNFDWTRSPSPPTLSSHIDFVRSFDWASTPIGPMETWPPLLRSICTMIMADPDPAAVFWGDSANMIYNESFILIAGQKHPDLMGQHPSVPFAEVWDRFEGIFENCRSTGKSIKEDDVCLFLHRHGFLEETYVSYTFTPVLGEEGTVVGNYHTVCESTKTIITDRRMSMLLKISQFTATALQLKDYWGQVLLALESNENDIPFAILYSVDGKDEFSSGSYRSVSIKQCVFAGSIGVSPQCRITPLFIDLEQDLDGFAPAFRKVKKEGKPLLFRATDSAFPKALLTNVTSRGFGDPSTGAIVCPLLPTHDKSIFGFLAIGLNSRRPYDKDYQLFIELLSRQLATSLASTVLYEEERYRRRTAVEVAEINQAKLSKELALRVQEIKHTEQRFTQVTQLAPVGIFIQEVSGRVVYCNDKFDEITGHQGDFHKDLAWKANVVEEDSYVLDKEWGRLLDEKIPITFEMRLRTPWRQRPQIDGVLVDEPTWILTSAYPELSADGSIISILGCITDISQQKWAERVQQRIVKDALEAKRQQENFIDMTSHEIRNPLSAITHCADEIITTLRDLGGKESHLPAEFGQSVSSSIDAAQTILICAQHQKNVVDDILTLSKLDSNLLVTTPVRSNPVEVAEQALKMFEVQLLASDIKAKVYPETSLCDLQVQWVLLDSSRLLQILINLVTNAIKFTKSEPEREIQIRISASLDRPLASEYNIEYLPAKDLTKTSTEKDVFLHLAVKDTGCGISETERERLFSRFSQASPRTHVRYGGSGLGLFICRELIELQGGQIGFTSKPHFGSTFVFYIKAQRLGSTPAAISEIPYQNQSSTLALVPRSSWQMMPPSSLSVLVVEDNLVNQQILVRQLEKHSFSVGVANHGKEALEFIRGTRFWTTKKESGSNLSVILMDIEMPVMDGLSCTREIRRLQSQGLICSRIPIIAITANARDEQIVQAKHTGVDEVLLKPFRFRELMLLIEKTVQSGLEQ